MPSSRADRPRTTLPYTVAKVLIVITTPFLLIASGYIGFIAMFSCYGKTDCNSLLEGGVYVFPAVVLGVLAWVYYEVRRRSRLVQRENVRRAVSQEIGRPANPFEVDRLVVEILQARGPLTQRDVMELAGIKEEDVLMASTQRLLDQHLVWQQIVDQQVLLSAVSDTASSPSGFGHR